MAEQKYKRYSKEFKLEAVRLAQTGDKPVTQVARELGVRVNQLYKWCISGKKSWAKKQTIPSRVKGARQAKTPN